MRRHLSARWWELVLDLGARLIDVACRHLPSPFPAETQAEIGARVAGRLEGEREGAVLRRVLAEQASYRAARSNHRTGG